MYTYESMLTNYQKRRGVAVSVCMSLLQNNWCKKARKLFDETWPIFGQRFCTDYPESFKVPQQKLSRSVYSHSVELTAFFPYGSQYLIGIVILFTSPATIQIIFFISTLFCWNQESEKCPPLFTDWSKGTILDTKIIILGLAMYSMPQILLNDFATECF